MTKIYAEQDGDRFLINADGHAGDVEACNFINGALYSFAGYVHNAEIVMSPLDTVLPKSMNDTNSPSRTGSVITMIVCGL